MGLPRGSLLKLNSCFQESRLDAFFVCQELYCIEIEDNIQEEFNKFLTNSGTPREAFLAIICRFPFSEILGLATSSGEIVITNNNLEILSSLEIN